MDFQKKRGHPVREFSETQLNSFSWRSKVWGIRLQNVGLPWNFAVFEIARTIFENRVRPLYKISLKNQGKLAI